MRVSRHGLTLIDERLGLRIAVEMRARVGSSKVGTRQGTVVDISTCGCRIVTPFNPPPATYLVVTMPTLTAMAAVVRWSTCSEIGLSFLQPLHSATVERLATTFRNGMRAQPCYEGRAMAPAAWFGMDDPFNA